jgi:ABC-type uncharacterized transport system substrate-binding protein
MNRRDFIALVGGAAVAWPLAARAQQAERMRRIGVLVSLPADDPQAQVRNAALLQGLQELGWTVGRNVRVDFRWGAGNADRIRRDATELVALAPDVLLAPGTSTREPLLQATRAVPIVFVHVADPVGGGFVESLARPGGNATGFTNLEYGVSGKWLELLKQLAPRVTRVAVLRDSTVSSGTAQFATRAGANTSRSKREFSAWRANYAARQARADGTTGGEASWCRMSTSSACAREPRSLKASIGFASVSRLSRVSRRMR